MKKIDQRISFAKEGRDAARVEARIAELTYLVAKRDRIADRLAMAAERATARWSKKLRRVEALVTKINAMQAELGDLRADCGRAYARATDLAHHAARAEDKAKHTRARFIAALEGRS